MKIIKNKKIYEESDILIGDFWQHKNRENEILKIVGFDRNVNKEKIVIYKIDGVTILDEIMTVHLFLLNYRKL